MFCSKCGHRIPSNQGICANCGASAATAEVCGGFWGLVGEKPPAPPSVVPPEIPIPMAPPAPPVRSAPSEEPNSPSQPNPPARKSGSAYRRKRRRVSLLPWICAVLLVFGAVQTVRLHSAETQVEQVQAQLTSVKDELTQFQAQSRSSDEAGAATQSDTAGARDAISRILNLFGPDDTDDAGPLRAPQKVE